MLGQNQLGKNAKFKPPRPPKKTNQSQITLLLRVLWCWLSNASIILSYTPQALGAAHQSSLGFQK